MSSSTSMLTTPTTREEAPPVVVDPGQVIRVVARFPDFPDDVFFSFMPPNSNKAVHDPGAGKPGSRIKQNGDLYSFALDTSLMEGGLGWWYFQSKDRDPSKGRAKVGRFVVRDVPRALIDRDRALIGHGSSFDLFGVQLSFPRARQEEVFEMPKNLPLRKNEAIEAVKAAQEATFDDAFGLFGVERIEMEDEPSIDNDLDESFAVD